MSSSVLWEARLGSTISEIVQAPTALTALWVLTVCCFSSTKGVLGGSWWHELHVALSVMQADAIRRCGDLYNKTRLSPAVKTMLRKVLAVL